MNSDITFSLDDALVEQVRRYAEREGTTLEHLILRCLEELAGMLPTPRAGE
jgi:hypothetical protein